MNFYRLIFRSLWHYRRQSITIALGMAIVKVGLQNLVGIRLGNIDLSASSGDRYLTDSLTRRIQSDLGIPVTSALQLEGSATAGGGEIRLPKVQVFGIDPSFKEVLGPGTFDSPVNENEAIISDNMASRLNVSSGDEMLIRISKPGPVPIDAPFVSDAENIIQVRVTIKQIAGKELHGRFHLQNTQSAPFNVFLNKTHLQKLAGLDGLSNLILMAGNGRVSAELAEQAITNNRSIGDAGLNLSRHPVTGKWILRTPRVFFDAATLKAIESVPVDKNFFFSYFINEFQAGANTTPYSFVSTLPDNQVGTGEILINRWLADDLKAGAGDSVVLSYFMVGPLRNLTVQKTAFRIAGILEMNDPRCDRTLMPEIPGLSDAGNCRDWETSIPINLDKIRDKDESYWNEYRGTPKAFINPVIAASLWENRFGRYTQVQFNSDIKQEDIIHGILSHLKPSDIGIVVREPAHEGMAAAASGVDFSGLFLGLSFFLIAGGIILTILLIRLGVEGRKTQIGTYRAMGWPEKRVRRLLLLEYSLVGVIGTLLGLVLTFFYTTLIFKALGGVWNDIVLTDALQPIFKPTSLLLGTGISILVSFGSAWLALRQFFKHKGVELMSESGGEDWRFPQKILLRFSAFAGFWSVLMLVYGIWRIESVSATFFFTAGTTMLVSQMLLAIGLIKYHTTGKSQIFNLNSLSLSNIRQNSNRSLSVILLFSIGMFMVIAIGANRKSVPRETQAGTQNNASLRDPSGTGGFTFYMETTVPVPDNLNKPDIRAKYGLETPSEFVQMKKLQGDDASCLNLNRVSNPPLLGVPAGSFSGRFRFQTLEDDQFKADPWKMLEQTRGKNIITAVADQTVIQWGLGLKIGDTLKYKTETGDTLHVVLAGGLANSIFQGNVLISETNFMQHWPSVSGTNILLVGANRDEIEPVKSELENIFRDYGADLKPATSKLAEYNSVENTYLSIFLVMGALAMLLGTIGLAIILARNLQERRSEIALFRATGFSKKRILWLLVREYFLLLIYGTLAGGMSALVSILPGLFNPAGEVSSVFLLSILGIMLLNGLLWILVLGWNAVKKPGIIESLRTE